MAIIARAALAAAAIAFVSSAALAQDATKVDPKHYKVITKTRRCGCYAFTTDPMRQASVIRTLIRS